MKGPWWCVRGKDKALLWPPTWEETKRNESDSLRLLNSAFSFHGKGHSHRLLLSSQWDRQKDISKRWSPSCDEAKPSLWRHPRLDDEMEERLRFTDFYFTEQIAERWSPTLLFVPRPQSHGRRAYKSFCSKSNFQNAIKGLTDFLVQMLQMLQIL